MGRTGDSDGKNDKATVTLDEAMLLSGFGIYTILHMLMSGLMLMGMITLSLALGFVLPAAQCDLDLTMHQKSWLSALPFAAIILSSYFWGWIADTKGRRPTILVSMCLSIIGTLLTSFAPNLISFAVLQFITGIFTTGPSAIVYTYLGECSNLRHRDKMVTFGSSFIGLGSVFLPCLAWVILPLQFSYPLQFLGISYRSWRLYLVVATMPFVLASIFLLFAFESPKFLYASGKNDEALEVVKTMYAVNSRKSRDTFPVKSLIVENQITKLNECKGVRAVFASMKEQTFPIFTPPLLQWICFTCFVHFGIFAAANGFFIWLPTILNSLAASESSNMKICDVIESQMEVAAKVSKNTTVICEDTIYTSTFEQSIYVSLAFYSMYFIAGALVDFVGKKMLLIVILTVTGMCGVGAHLANNQQTAVILFGIFQMSGACIGLVNAVGVELFPTKYRAMAICLSMMVGRVGAVIGSNLIGWFLEVNCGAGFYLFGLLLVVDGLVCLALPNKKKDKLSALAVSVQRPEHEL